MRFVQSHRQSDKVTSDLSPANWPVEFVIISNEAGHDAFLNQNRIHTILDPAILGTYRLTPARTILFPALPTTENGTMSLSGIHPTRPYPRRMATRAPMALMGLVASLLRHAAESTIGRPPSLGHTPPYILPPSRPLRIAELCGGLSIGLEAFVSYIWAGTDPYKHMAISHHLARLRNQ